MIGHRQVVAARRAGIAIPEIYIHAGPHPERIVRGGFTDPEKTLYYSAVATVYTGEELPNRHDLRFVNGIGVYLVSDPYDVTPWMLAIEKWRPRFLFGIDEQQELFGGFSPDYC